MKVVRTITIDGKSNEEYAQIIAHLEELKQHFPGWELIKEPLVNRVTAVKTEEVQSLQPTGLISK